MRNAEFGTDNGGRHELQIKENGSCILSGQNQNRRADRSYRRLPDLPRSVISKGCCGHALGVPEAARKRSRYVGGRTMTIGDKIRIWSEASKRYIAGTIIGLPPSYVDPSWSGSVEHHWLVSWEKNACPLVNSGTLYESNRELEARKQARREYLNLWRLKKRGGPSERIVSAERKAKMSAAAKRRWERARVEK